MAKKPLSKAFLNDLASAEAKLKLSLGTLRKMRRRAHAGPPPPPKIMALAAAPAGPSKKVKVYEQLLGLFASDHKPIAEVRPESALGKYPLGYEDDGLEDFYRYKVNPWFAVNLSSSDVGTDGTVNDLVDAIIAAGGNPR